MKMKLFPSVASGLAASALFVSLSFCDISPPQAVPLRDIQDVSLEVGSFRVSRYLVDKYYNRFLAEKSGQEHRPATEGEKGDWVDQFVAKQILIAHAESLGYMNRPEVVAAVSLMERNMLTQVDGPLYQRLLSDRPPLSDQKLRALFAESANLIDCTIARYDDESSETKALGVDFDRCSVEKQAHRVQLSRAADATAMVDGWVGWPFAPAEEIAEELNNDAPGHWIRHTGNSKQVYCVYVRSLKPGAAGDFDGNSTGFRMITLRIENDLEKRRHEQEILTSSHFSINVPLATHLAEALGNAPAADQVIPVEAVKGISDKALYEYEPGTERIAVTVESFRSYLNRQYLRRIPTTPEDVRERAREMAAEELDFRAALARGLDHEPQFAEERKGFWRFQALDLFEREVVVPNLRVSASAIVQYYTSHITQFVVPTRIRGRLVTFSNPADPVRWLAQHRTNSISNLATPNPVVPVLDRELEVERGHLIPGFENFGESMFSGAEGRSFGPAKTEAGYSLFLKEQNGALEPAPLDVVASSIRKSLESASVATKERELAAEIARNLIVINHIGYGRPEATGTVLAENLLP